MWKRSRNCPGSWVGLRGQGIGQVFQLYPILFSEYFWGVSLPCVLILGDITAGSRKVHKTKTPLVVSVEPRPRPRQDSPWLWVLSQRCHCARGATVQCAIANGWVSGLTNLQNLSPSYLAHCCAIFLLSSWATNYIKPTDGNQRQTMQHHTLRVVLCNAHKKHVVQFGKALHLVAVLKKHKIWTTLHFWTSLQPEQKMLLDMVDVGFHKIQRP